MALLGPMVVVAESSAADLIDVLGKAGATIKSIGADSRKEIAEIMGVPVHLFLFVKVRENWGDDPNRYREMGLEFPKE